MAWRDFLALIVITMLVVIIVVMLSFNIEISPSPSLPNNNFHFIKWGRAGDYGYVVFSYNGTGNVMLASYNQTPKKEIAIIHERGIGMEKFDEFVSLIKNMENQGFRVRVVQPFTNVRDSIYIVPTGAMPFYLPKDFDEKNNFYIYMGRKDLTIRNGVKRENWYSQLNNSQKNNLLIYETTIDDFMESNNKTGFLDAVLKNSWAVNEIKNRTFYAGNGKNDSFIIDMKNSTNVRLVFSFGNKTSVIDSPHLALQEITFPSFSVFPGEKAMVLFSINQSSGNVFLTTEKDGQEFVREKLQRVTDENVFLRPFLFENPGNYIIKISDNNGIRGGGMVHVKLLEIKLQEYYGIDYLFNITLDSQALKDGFAEVWLREGGKKQQFPVHNGVLRVTAKPPKGKNNFYFYILNQSIKTEVENTNEELGDVYFKYGIPGLAIVVLVYLLARLGQKPVYKIRLGDSVQEVRKNIYCSPKDVIEAFQLSRERLGINGPLTAYEFTIGVKQKITEGADVTEGNMEQLLKEMCKRSIMHHHRGFYELEGEGNVKRNVIKRMLREKLIEKGIAFEVKGDRFILPYVEIGFFGDHFSKKALIVFESEQEIKNHLKNLSEKEKAKVRLSEYNEIIKLATIEDIEEIL